MPKGPDPKRPLTTVLQELALQIPGLVLIQGPRAYQIEREAVRARREAKSGHPDVRVYLSEHRFWWDEDPEGKVVVWRENPEGPKPIAVEYGSRYTAWTLENEGDGGPEMILSGSLGRRQTCEGEIFERRCYTPGEVYSFNDLPSLSRKDALSQRADFEAHFGRGPETMAFRFLLVPHQEVVRLLHNHYGSGLEAAMHSQAVKKLSHSIEREGLKYPAVADEGWKRALAMASLGRDLPYFEVLEPFDMPYNPGLPTLEGARRPSPELRTMREGFYRMIQRVHRGIPGLKGTGEIYGDHFNGGAAGVKTAWPIKPHGTGIPDAVSIAGFYSFGTFWPKMIEMMGLPDNVSDVARVLEKEFGLLSDDDLSRGTVPIPKAR